MNTPYILRVLIAIDQLINVVICNGEPDETMSSAVYRMERDGYFWGFMRPVIDWFAYPFQREHCKKAYESELLKLQQPDEIRNATYN